MNLTYTLGLTALPLDYAPATPLMAVKHIPGARVICPPPIHKAKPYTAEENETLRDMYADATPDEILAALDHKRSWPSIQSQAHILKLKRSKAAKAATCGLVKVNAARKAK